MAVRTSPLSALVLLGFYDKSLLLWTPGVLASEFFMIFSLIYESLFC